MGDEKLLFTPGSVVKGLACALGPLVKGTVVSVSPVCVSGREWGAGHLRAVAALPTPILFVSPRLAPSCNTHHPHSATPPAPTSNSEGCG